jgi:hypothetical protein
MTGLLGDLAIGHHVPRFQPPDHREDILLERHGG